MCVCVYVCMCVCRIFSLGFCFFACSLLRPYTSSTAQRRSSCRRVQFGVAVSTGSRDCVGCILPLEGASLVSLAVSKSLVGLVCGVMGLAKGLSCTPLPFASNFLFCLSSAEDANSTVPCNIVGGESLSNSFCPPLHCRAPSSAVHLWRH